MVEEVFLQVTVKVNESLYDAGVDDVNVVVGV